MCPSFRTFLDLTASECRQKAEKSHGNRVKVLKLESEKRELEIKYANKKERISSEG